MGNIVEDAIGRRLEVNMDFQDKRIFVNLHRPEQASIAAVTFTPKQALKLATILTEAVRHTLGWKEDDD